MVFSQTLLAVMPGARPLRAAHGAALQRAMGYVQPISSGFSLPHCARTQPRAGADES